MLDNQRDWSHDGPGHMPSSAETTVSVRTDEDITQNIRDLLALDGRVNVANVTVRSYRGVVTFGGVVTSAQDKKIAEEIARSVPGVVDVVDEIIVVPTRETGGK